MLDEEPIQPVEDCYRGHDVTFLALQEDDDLVEKVHGGKPFLVVNTIFIMRFLTTFYQAIYYHR